MNSEAVARVMVERIVDLARSNGRLEANAPRHILGPPAQDRPERGETDASGDDIVASEAGLFAEATRLQQENEELKAAHTTLMNETVMWTGLHRAVTSARDDLRAARHSLLPRMTPAQLRKLSDALAVVDCDLSLALGAFQRTGA